MKQGVSEEHAGMHAYTSAEGTAQDHASITTSDTSLTLVP